MYIGKDKNQFGNVPLFNVSFGASGGEGYNETLPVNTKEEGRVGTLYLTKELNEDITYVEWCKESKLPGSGIKIQLKELINLMESLETQD